MSCASLTGGSSVGRYQICEFLGAGGMGEVYSAFDPVLERQVALKVLPSSLTSDPLRVERLKVEARAASSLNHPAIITIYEIGEASLEAAPDESRHFIAMELIDGITLDQWLAGRPRLASILHQIARIAEGIGKAHSRGVIHRDLKPENVMITSDEFPRIVDFGLAKLFEIELDSEAESGMHRRQLTNPATLLGTIGYMSPEQVEALPVDHRTDIFSLGCILYEGITGTSAFAGATNAETLHAIVHRDPPRITLDDPQLKDRLQRILDRCLARDRDQRYDSARDLALDLREVAAIAPSGSVRTGVVRTLGRARQPLRFVAGTIVVLLLAVLMGSVVSRPEVRQLERALLVEGTRVKEKELDLAQRDREIERILAERENDERLRAELEQSYRSLLADVNAYMARNESERSRLRERAEGAESERSQLRTRVESAEAELEDHRAARLRATQQERLARIQRQLSTTSEARVDGLRVVVTLPGTLFESGSVQIGPEAVAIVRELTAHLIAHPELKITIEGHTDSRGGEMDNLVLSQRRADGIRELLVASGVEQTRITSLGRGEQFPAYPNDTLEGRTRNRRIEVSLSLGES